MSEASPIVVRSDPRGTLVAAELDGVPFAARRVFTVTGVPGGAVRGDHATPCQEFIVLVAGSVTVEVGVDGSGIELGEPITLDRPGASLHLAAGRFVRYRLADETSTILVFAESPYEDVT